MSRVVLHGFAVSSGIAMGKAFFLNKRPEAEPRSLIPRDKIAEEFSRYERATAFVRAELEETLQSLPKGMETHAEILESHLLICQDAKLKEEVRRFISERRMNAEWALNESLELIVARFQQIESPYIRERAQDVRLVCRKILQHLQGISTTIPKTWEEAILLANDITPAEALSLAQQPVLAFATEQGGVTSHSGIIARSMHIPAVIGVRGIEDDIQEGDFIIIDGFSGRVIVAPDPHEIDKYSQKSIHFQLFHKHIAKEAAFPAETTDGCRITMYANIDVCSEAETVIANGGEGIGLVRTEFSYISHGGDMEEEELFQEYDYLASTLFPHPVNFRTLDMGADKILHSQKDIHEENPVLGLRSVRFCLRRQDIFRRQIRAILRASARGNTSIMFPLISSVDEFRVVRSIMNEARQELLAEGIPFDAAMPVGIMVELPAAVMIADVLAREVDFFSIGTNDLIQYTMGADRGNRNVAHLHQPLNPSILRSIKIVIDTAHAAGISVSVCGEMAADPFCIPLLIGMEADSLSVSAQSIPLAKYIVRHNAIDICRKMASTALNLSSSKSISNLVLHEAYLQYPEDIPFFSGRLPQ